MKSILSDFYMLHPMKEGMFSLSSSRHAERMQHEADSKSSKPGDDALEDNHPHGPSRPVLPLDGSDRRDAWRVEQAKGQESERHARCH